MFVTAGQGQKKKKAPPPPPGTGGTKDRQQQKHPSSLSLSSNDQDVADPHNKTTSLERHLSGKSSVVGSAQSSDKCSSLPGKMKMSQHDYRPAEPPTQKSENAAETEARSPEERRLDSDQIPEVEEDTAITRQDERNTAARSQISGDSSDIQDESFQSLPLPPVESAPPPHVELASRSKSHQVVDPSTPEGKLKASNVELSNDVSSLEGRRNLEGAPSSPCRYKEKCSGSFCSESPAFTSRYSLRPSGRNPARRRSSETHSSKLQTIHQNSNMKILSDVYNHQIKIGHGMACSKLPDHNSEQELRNLIPRDELIQPSCNQISYRSSLNSDQKLVNSDSHKLKPLVGSSSVVTAQRNSDFVAASPEKYTCGFEADVCNHSASENVICPPKLDKVTSGLTSEQIKCSSAISQERFIPNGISTDIKDTSDKHSTSQNVCNTPYNSPTASKQKYDGRRVERQMSPNRVSLLVPPPEDFPVSRGESIQSWNKFLQDLDRILENRAEFV